MYLSVDLVKLQYTALNESVAGGKVTVGRVTNWLLGASNLIDSYLGSRFDLPFAVTPPMVTTLSYNFFEYFWQRDVHLPTSTDDEIQWLITRYNKDIKLLEQLRDGELSLLDSSGEMIAPSTVKLETMRSNHQEIDQIFWQTKESYQQSVPEDYDEEPTF